MLEIDPLLREQVFLALPAIMPHQIVTYSYIQYHQINHLRIHI